MMKLPIIFAIFYSLQLFSIEGTYQFIIKKQEQKRQSRWTLSDWLATKRRMALMDQWLLLNSSVPAIEAYLDASQANVNDDNPLYYMEDSFQRYGGGVFFYPLGVEYRNSNLNDGSNIEYLASLRLLGSSLQTTNLILSYGRNVRESSAGDEKNDFYQGRINLYLFDFLGIESGFRNYIDNNNELNTIRIEGNRFSYGAFVEIEFFRAYLEAFVEKFTLTTLSNNSESEIKNKGAFVGIKLFL